jgi:glycosyltransferase involved in cell wall biosynthesis
MRFLLVNNHCITDPTAGVTQSLRTIVKWLADAGHSCRVLTTARFEAAVRFTIAEHLRELGVSVPHPRGAGTIPIVRYKTSGVPVTLLLTEQNDESRPDAHESDQYIAAFEKLIEQFRPDQVIACNGHPMVFEALARARRAGITTAFAVRGYGYYDRRYFEHVDHVFTCSEYLTGVYHDTIGLISTPLEPPIDWSTVLAPGESRRFLTFVHPAVHKGLLLFARLADMLGSRRPDIPIMVVQSGATAGSLNGIPGFDFSRYPQIVAAPPVLYPADYFGLTRVLLVPSAWDEPFGRVAAESMINAIPPIVSNRGALPQVVGGDYTKGGGGFVVPLPEWMTSGSLEVPSESDVQPWYERVCSVWDDPALYKSAGQRARRIAEERYSEEVSRKKHVEYFTSLRPGSSPVRQGPSGLTGLSTP